MDRGLHREGDRMNRGAAWLFLILAPICAAFGASCSVVHHGGGTTGGTGGGGSGGSPAGTGGSVAVTGRSIFESTVKTPLLMECGACHGLGGVADAPFLATPDVYVS